MNAATRPVSAPLDRAQLSSDHLWTPAEAAYFLGVSQRYLRASRCPKVLLPGNGAKGQPIVRYDPKAVREWAAQWSTTRTRERVT